MNMVVGRQFSKDLSLSENIFGVCLAKLKLGLINLLTIFIPLNIPNFIYPFFNLLSKDYIKKKRMPRDFAFIISSLVYIFKRLSDYLPRDLY